LGVELEMSKPAAIFIGNQSALMGDVIDSVFDRYEFPAMSSLSVLKGFRKSASRNDKVSLCRCSHRLYESNFCQQCENNAEILYQGYRKLLEGQSWSSGLNLSFDFSDSFCFWTYNKLLEFCEEETPKSDIGTLLMGPPSRITGIDTFLSISAALKSIEQSSFLLYRGLDEYIREGSSSSLVDISKMLACDVSFAFFPHNGLFYNSGQYSNFPYHVCSFKDKIIDIRTSLYSSLAKIDTKKKKGMHNVDLHPLRILSSNLHEMHLRYLNTYPQLLSFLQSKTIPISFSTIKLDKKNKEVRFSSPPYQKIDIENAINWATNGSWKFDLLEENFRTRTLTGHKSSRSKETTEGSASPSISGDFAVKPLDVSILVSKSLYAEMTLLRLCEQAKLLINCNAFRYQFENTIFSQEMILDQIFCIENYFKKE
jgi:hypothetical protein